MNDTPTAAEIPTAVATRRGPDLIIENCPRCGQRHIHGNVEPDDVLVTHRAAHCARPPHENRGGYWILIDHTEDQDDDHTTSPPPLEPCGRSTLAGTPCRIRMPGGRPCHHHRGDGAHR